ncbi:hypothetical protein [Pseudarcicella hirudinis]|uniref:hypothetical protein n=1 Tax=Pseudarcicella hirudinis TaxID=1079859 RepID=UPI000B80C2EF|nr:hypothetical protein [Pseudarcicella hirudinis]
MNKTIQQKIIRAKAIIESRKQEVISAPKDATKKRKAVNTFKKKKKSALLSRLNNKTTPLSSQ